MYPHGIVWSKAPFVRLIIPLATGIFLEWETGMKPAILLIVAAISFLSVLWYSFVPIQLKYRLALANGAAINMLLLSLGAILVYINDPRHWKTPASTGVVAGIEEPLSEKTNSFKTIACLYTETTKDNWQNTGIKFIVYLKKDSSVKHLHYGSMLWIKKPLEPIKNSGNPGSFDYKKYCLFNGITQQVYLTQNDYQLLDSKNRNGFKEFLFAGRAWITGTLKKWIPGKREQGFAEAMLIGYKEDLDKNLVQAYSNTGTVHIIAISGLHLGLIYMILLFLTRPLEKKKELRWQRLLLIIFSLWLFSFLAGAQPSVLRSTIMFTFLAAGAVLNRKSSIYNSLALSAFILLCYNPFYLWDAGFQLSYAAVLSIIILFRPLYNAIYFENKLLDAVWKLVAVTMSAQVLTMPVCIYHFHQLPLLFLFTNIVAVPVGSFVLVAELLLCSLWWCEPVAASLGLVLSKTILFLNSYIERFDNVSFAVWSGLQISSLQVALLFAMLGGVCYWLLENHKLVLWPSLCALLGFACLHSYALYQAHYQKKLVVYNVPKHSAIDFINGRNYKFISNDELSYNTLLRNFYLQPARTLYRLNQNSQAITGNSFQFAGRHILLLDSAMSPNHLKAPEVLIISKNAKLNTMHLDRVRQVVIDASVPRRKAVLWQQQCDALGIPCHNVAEKGAFVMSLR